MKETSDWKHDPNSRALEQHTRTILTIDDAFVESWASAAIRRGAFAGEPAEQLLQVVSGLLENLYQKLRPGQRFSLDALGTGIHDTAPYYVEKTPHGLVIGIDVVPCEE